MCAQQRLRSARASAQSDQSLRCLHEETGRMPRLISVFTGRTVFVLVLSWGGSYLLWMLRILWGCWKIAKRWLRIFFHHIFHFSTNLSFSYTFELTQQHTDAIWRFMRCNFILEYCKRPPLVAPFVFFFHIYLLLRHKLCKKCCRFCKTCQFRPLYRGICKFSLLWSA